MSSSPNQLKNITSLTHIELIKQTTELMLKGNYQYSSAWQNITSYHNRLGWTNPDSVKIRNYLQAILNKYEPTEQQDKDALVVCGMIYQFAEIGDANPFKKAMTIYKLAEASGSSQAINNIGLMYKQGLGVKQDYAKEISYYERAIKLGNASAMYNLGCMYNYGEGVKEDYGKAKSYYKKAAKLDNAYAMTSLGYMYRYGQGGKQDYGKAKSYFKKVAKLGNAYAINNLGSMYQHGQGVKKDYAKAARLYRLALKYGSKAAGRNLKRKIAPAFSYHLAMLDNNITKAAKVIVDNPELIKEVEAFDCKHLADGVSSRESIVNLIMAISIAKGFENNKGLGRAVERLKQYVEIPSLEKLISTTIKEHNEDNPSSKIDYSFFSSTLIEMTELPEIKTNTNSKASENDNHERPKL